MLQSASASGKIAAGTLATVAPVMKPLMQAFAYGMAKVASIFISDPNWDDPSEAARAAENAKRLATIYRFVPTGMIEGVTDDWQSWADEIQRRIDGIEAVRAASPQTWADWQTIVGWVDTHSNDPTLLDLESLGWWPLSLDGAASKQGAFALGALLAKATGKDPKWVQAAIAPHFDKAWQTDLRYTTNKPWMWNNTMQGARYAVDRAPAASPAIFISYVATSAPELSMAPMAVSEPTQPIAGKVISYGLGGLGLALLAFGSPVLGAASLAAGLVGRLLD